MRYLALYNILSQIGIVLIVAAAIGYNWFPMVSAWVMMGGALLMAPYYIQVSFNYGSDEMSSVRQRRLNRWGLLAAFHYFLAGLFMYRGSKVWVLLLAVSTVFLLASIFLNREKHEKQ